MSVSASLDDLRQRIEGPPSCACQSCSTNRKVSVLVLKVAAGISVAREELLADQRTSSRRIRAKLHDAATELVGLAEALSGPEDAE
jgi:hypothetical protein